MKNMVTGTQIRAARAITRWTVGQLAARTRVDAPTIHRAEACDGDALLTPRDVEAITAAFERAGVHFLDDNGGGPGVRAKGRTRCPDDELHDGIRPEQLTSENHL